MTEAGELRSLAAVLAWRPDIAAGVALLPATWHEDNDGVGHGRLEHALTTGQAREQNGTLGDALTRSLCPHSDCVSVRRLAGDHAAAKAAQAQKEAARISNHDVHARDLIGNPGQALIEARRLLTDTRKLDEAFERRLKETAGAAERILQTTSEQDSMKREAARRVLRGSAQSPLRDLEQILTRTGANGPDARSLIANCDGSAEWLQKAYAEAEAGLPDPFPSEAVVMLGPDALEIAAANATTMLDALNEARRTLLRAKISEVIPWWEAEERRIVADSRKAVIVAEVQVLQLLDPRYEVYRHRPSSPILVAPYAIGLSVSTPNSWHEPNVPVALVDEEPAPETLETLATLVRDAGDRATDTISELLKVAAALTRSEPRQGRVKARRNQQCSTEEHKRTNTALGPHTR